ncbi:MAG: hypothetical protein AAFN93_06430 [Bacteroidota bacterium]
MQRLKKIGVLSLAKFQTILMALLGLVCGILYSFGGLIIDIMVSLGWLSAEDMETPGLSEGTLLAFGALIGMPLIGAFIGFVVGIIEGLTYNLYSRWFGGIKMKLG